MDTLLEEIGNPLGAARWRTNDHPAFNIRGHFAVIALGPQYFFAVLGLAFLLHFGADFDLVAVNRDVDVFFFDTGDLSAHELRIVVLGHVDAQLSRRRRFICHRPHEKPAHEFIQCRVHRIETS